MKDLLLAIDYFIASQIAQCARWAGLTPRGLDVVMFLLLGLSSLIVAIASRDGSMLSIGYAAMGVMTLAYVNLMASMPSETVKKVYLKHHRSWQSPWRPISVFLIPIGFYGLQGLRAPVFLWLMLTLADYARSLHVAHFMHSPESRPPSS